LTNPSTYIKAFLLKNKTLSLEKLGTFTFDDNNNNISFDFNKRITTTPELIDFIAKSEKRSPILVKNDLTYFLDEARELMNIGARPLVIEDLGYLYLDNEKKGYIFSAEPLTPLKEKESIMTKVGSEAFSPTSTYSNEYTSDTKRTGMNILSAIVILLIIGGIGYGVYYFLSLHEQKEYNNNANNPQTEANIDSSQQKQEPETKTPDSAKQDSATLVKNNPGIYKFVFETTPHVSRAYLRVNQLKEYGDSAMVDSVPSGNGTLYKLYIPIKKEGLDTTRAKDSLRKYFQRNITIE
jgi:hypothetical protein